MQGVYVDTVFGFSLNFSLHNCILIQNKTRWWVISPLGVLQLCAASKIRSVWVIKPIDFPHMHKYIHRSCLSPLNLDSQVCHQKIYPFPNTPWMACHIPAFIISTSINQTTRLCVTFVLSVTLYQYGSIPAVYHSKAVFLKLQPCLPGTFVSFGQLLGGSFAPFTPPAYQVNAAAGLLQHYASLTCWTQVTHYTLRFTACMFRSLVMFGSLHSSAVSEMSIYDLVTMSKVRPNRNFLLCCIIKETVGENLYQQVSSNQWLLSKIVLL